MSMQTKGVALLMIVIIIGAASLIMTLGSAMLGIGSADGSYTTAQGGEAFSLVDGCMEDTLERLRVDNAYAATTLSNSNGTCALSISGSGSNRTIVISGTANSYTKKIQATVTLIPANRSITVTSWQELTN